MRVHPIALILLAAPAVAAPTLTPADTVAAYAAAGYATRDKVIIGCNGDDPARPASRYDLQLIDLNIDGRAEAIIGEDNPACYGSMGSSFTIVGKDVGGRWHRLGGTAGIATKLATRRLGWSDIAAGLPGKGKARVLRWNGTHYQ